MYALKKYIDKAMQSIKVKIILLVLDMKKRKENILLFFFFFSQNSEIY
jgi:hypothetical protein